MRGSSPRMTLSGAAPATHRQGELDDKITRRKIHHRHRRGSRHRAGDRAALRGRGCQGRGQRSRRRRRRLRIERGTCRRGGRAGANFETRAEAIPASKIVKTAIDSFGKLDGVVNNAGILRDAIFHRMSIDAFESVIKVHLMGSFYVSHAAARLFREQESGSFVHFTSTSGLVGNFGQANYAAAKLGIVGLSKSIALDMNRFNVRSNCVSPFAWSRLIGTIPTETEAEKARVEKIKQMGPEKIAPVVAYLLGDASKDVTGQIFGVRMNEIFLFSQNRPLRSVQRTEGWTPQTVAEHAMPALKPSFYKLDRSADIFSWDAI